MKVVKMVRKNRHFVQKLLIHMMMFDLWVLTSVPRWSRKIIRSKPMLSAFITIGIAAGLLFYYGVLEVKLKMTAIDGIVSTVKSAEQPLIGIEDASSKMDPNSGLEREINHLRSKALSLEMAIRRMNSQMRSFQSRDRCKEEDLADFASEAAGGSILDTPNTVSHFEPKGGQLTLFGIPLCKHTYFTPRKVIQPWTQAGECWAFSGSQGNVKIELAYVTMIDQVTLEHIPVSASLTGKIDSAPKDFRVTAIFPERSMIIGTFIYKQYGPPSQTFQIPEDRHKNIPTKIVMLEVLSNWGNPDYTCIYRFKAHGRISP